MTRHLEAGREKLAAVTRKRMHRQAMERRHLVALKAKAHGHDSAQRLSLQLRVVTGKLVRLLRDYNKQKAFPPGEEVTIDLVRDPEADFFSEIAARDAVAYSVRKSAVFSHQLLQRAEEEREAIPIEVAGLMTHYQKCHAIIKQKLVSAENLGTKARLLFACEKYEFSQAKLCTFARQKLNLNLEADQSTIRRLVRGMYAPEAPPEDDSSGSSSEGDDSNPGLLLSLSEGDDTDLDGDVLPTDQ